MKSDYLIVSPNETAHTLVLIGEDSADTLCGCRMKLSECRPYDDTLDIDLTLCRSCAAKGERKCAS